jgi:hypothetical protein
MGQTGTKYIYRCVARCTDWCPSYCPWPRDHCGPWAKGSGQARPTRQLPCRNRLDLTPFRGFLRRLAGARCPTDSCLTAAECMTIVADFGLAFEQWRRHALMCSQSSASKPRPNLIGRHTSLCLKSKTLPNMYKYFQYRTPKRHMVNSTADVAFGYTLKQQHACAGWVATYG